MAGDIVSLAGIEDIDLGETVADIDQPLLLPAMDIDEPTLAMTFAVNDSPFAGRKAGTSPRRQLHDRLRREILNNASLRLEDTASKKAFLLKGRGTLQLSILIENMRREGYEFQVSKPGGDLPSWSTASAASPWRLAVIDVADAYAGVVIEMLGQRKGELRNLVPGSDGYTRLEFLIPARGLIGVNNDFMTSTRGTGILNHILHGLRALQGRDEPQDQGGAGGASSPASPWPTACSACRSAAACSSAPACRSTPA